MAPLISVIIPTYNRITWLSEAIESVLAQTYRPLEIIVVDDGSTNNDAENLIAKYPKIQYFKKTHGGSGAARNAGVKICKGEFIQFLDDDDWLTSTAIEEKFAVFQQKPIAGIVYSNIQYVNEFGKDWGSFYTNAQRPLPSGDLYTLLIEHSFILIHAALWRRDVITRAGGFPERSLAEDRELFVRAAEFCHFEPIDHVHGYYRLHQKNTTLKSGSLIEGVGQLQNYIVNSQRFQMLPTNLRARILARYALKQWIDGDADQAKWLLNQAYALAPYSPYSLGMKTLLLSNRQFTRVLIHGWWKIRSSMTRNQSASDYLLQQILNGQKREKSNYD